MTKNKGFTLIELLVVIAIIGILSSVVLASVSSARSRANDAKAKGQLANIRGAAEIYYTGNSNSYASMNTVTASDATGSGLYQLLQSANYPYGPAVCNSDAGAYACSVPLNGTNNFWCVDSTGVSKSTAAAVAATNC